MKKDLAWWFNESKKLRKSWRLESDKGFLGIRLPRHPWPTEVERHEAVLRERERKGDRRVIGGIYW